MINFDNIKLTKKFYSIFVGILSLLLILTTLHELTSDVDPTINNILLVIVILLALVSLRGLSQSIVRRINQVSKCADALASGDLTQKIPHLGGDECK